MKQKNGNFLTMATATLKILDANAATWSSNVPFSALVNFIRDDLASTNTAQKGSGSISTGATLDKEVAGDAAIAQAVKLSKLAQVYALDASNNTLHDQIKITTTQMDRYSDIELVPVLRSIYEKLQIVATQVEPYGITAVELEKLKTLTNAFDDIKSNTRVIITERKGHNSNIPSLLRHMRSNFAKTDNLINIWNDQQKFMSDYQNARIILDLGGGHGTKDEPKG